MKLTCIQSATMEDLNFQPAQTRPVFQSFELIILLQPFCRNSLVAIGRSNHAIDHFQPLALGMELAFAFPGLVCLSRRRLKRHRPVQDEPIVHTEYSIPAGMREKIK